MLKKRRNIPEASGIYIFKTTKGKILYIGKAVNLKKRLSQYFHRQPTSTLQLLLSRADTIDWIVTEDEQDALLLEYNLVQQYQPPFNIRLKDDKSFPLIEITTSATFPGVYHSRRPKREGFLFGPIAGSRKAKELIDLVARVFKIRQCSDRLFNRDAPCLFFYIDRCSGPCAKKISAEEYRRQVDAATHFLKKGKERVTASLQRQMNQLAAQERYEEAQKLKEDLDLISRFSLQSYLASPLASDCEVFAFETADDMGYAIYFSVKKGRVRKSDFYQFQTVASSKGEIIKEFLLAFYQRQVPPPDICVSALADDVRNLEAFLSHASGRSVKIRIPRRGDKRKLVHLAEKNLEMHLRQRNYGVLARSLFDRLQLSRMPLWIEGYDISHFAEKQRVGVRVVFDKGKPQRYLYRNYLIKEAAAGDTEAIKEVLTRRFRNEREHPDLLLIDGGKPQLTAAMQVKQRLRLASDIIALAKGEERVFLEKGKSLVLPDGVPARLLLQQIRDEAHRRAIAHHRLRRDRV